MTLDGSVIANQDHYEQEFETIDLNVNIGPQHPATHGVFRMVLVIDGEVVHDVVPHIGYMHRGAEKLSENMDYRQAIGYQDRTEYLAQFNAEMTYVQAVEKLAGLEPPERAQYIRVILAELNRISSHFMFLGAFGTDLGVFGTSFVYAFRERENVLDLFEEVTGDRLMYAYFRPGGVAWDVPSNFKERVRVGVPARADRRRRHGQAADRQRDLHRPHAQRRRPVGGRRDRLRRDGSGAARLRRQVRPAQGRALLASTTASTSRSRSARNGDSYDRYLVRLEEIRESVKIVRQALAQLPDGPIMPERMPRLLRPAAGEVYMRCENPRGEYGIYLVSKGTTQPYRLRIRSSCFCNLSALQAHDRRLATWPTP